jgi:predicted nucleic acid-binding protein
MTAVAETVYLDVCCFRRPFDDAAQPRVRREAEAVAALLDAVARGDVRLVRSPAHDVENARNPREDRRLATALWLDTAAVIVPVDAETERRTRELAGLGFGPLDALHLACAEQATARWFATTDDRLHAVARRHRDALRVAVCGPGDIQIPEPGSSGGEA